MKKRHLILFISTLLLISSFCLSYPTDMRQFSVFASQWGKNAYKAFDLEFVRSFADVNGDLSVDLLDLMIISENWTDTGTLYDLGSMYKQLENLEQLNNAVQDYHQDHGHLPGEGRSPWYFIYALVMQTDINGDIINPPVYPADNLFGRYLDAIPVNLINESNTIRFDGPPAGFDEIGCGWRVNTQTGVCESDSICTRDTISFHNRIYGVYSTADPNDSGRINIFNGLSSIRYTPEPAGQNTHGWKFSEHSDYNTHIVPDDIGIPTTPEAGLSESALFEYRLIYFKNVLHLIRSAILHYRYEHHWQNPGQGPTSLREALTQITNENGEIYTEAMKMAGMAAFGPYLPAISNEQFVPANPFNNLYTVRVDEPEYGENTHGWYYESQTGRFLSDMCGFTTNTGLNICDF